jgi:hypothetical protein
MQNLKWIYKHSDTKHIIPRIQIQTHIYRTPQIPRNSQKPNCSQKTIKNHRKQKTVSKTPDLKSQQH